MRPALRLVLACALLTLAACAPVRVREDGATLRAQDAREAEFSRFPKWSLEARIAVSDRRGGGNADLHWQQDDTHFDLSVQAPITGRTWRIYGAGDDFVLEGAVAEPAGGAKAKEILVRELGWEAPVTELAYWVRGLRAPGTAAELVFDDQGRPVQLRQSGWQIDYRDWFANRSPPLPRKVFATRGKSRVRLFVEAWQMP